MKSVYQTLMSRRSVRRFTSQAVENEKVDKLLQAALLAPSSRGLKPCEFIVVTHPQTLSLLANSRSYGSAFLSGAPLAIVVIARTDKTDVWFEDASIAAAYMQLQACELGLGSCWVQIFQRFHTDGRTASEYVKQMLEIPADFEVLCMLAVGYPDEDKADHAEPSLNDPKIHRQIY